MNEVKLNYKNILKFTTMKLIMAEHQQKGIWYFSTLRKCAAYIGAADSNVRSAITKKWKCSGWSIEEIESDDILSKYIDPER